MEDRIHDQFCRCRACKPPLVGEATQELYSVRVRVVIWMGVMVFGLICWALVYRALFG